MLNNNHSFTRSHLPNPNNVSSNYVWKERHLVMVIDKLKHLVMVIDKLKHKPLSRIVLIVSDNGYHNKNVSLFKFAGIGYGLIFAPCTTIISFYFEERRSLANGLMVSFSGIGNLVFPYLYRYLIDSYGLHGALLIIGAVLFHACAASLFLRQPPQLLKNRKLTDEEIELTPEKKTDTSSGCVYEASRRIFKIDLFRIPKYTILLLAIIFQVGNYAGTIVALPGQVRSLKLGKDTIVLSVSLLGAAEMVSRAFLGWFGDLNILKRSTLFMICAFVSAVIAFVIPFLPYKSALLVYSVLVGTFSGSFWSLMGVLIVDCVGLDNFSPAFGLLSMFCAIAICISQPITGKYNCCDRLKKLNTKMFVWCTISI